MAILTDSIDAIAKEHGLTHSEKLVMTRVANGDNDTTVIAKKLGKSRETVRNQLKLVFHKTDTHTQSSLVALLLRMVCEYAEAAT